MFIYHFINNYGIETPNNIAYDSDMEYLESKVKKGEFKELVIVKRMFN